MNLEDPKESRRLKDKGPMLAAIARSKEARFLEKQTEKDPV